MLSAFIALIDPGISTRLAVQVIIFSLSYVQNKTKKKNLMKK